MLRRLDPWFTRRLKTSLPSLTYVVLLCVPSIALLYFINVFGVNVIFWDEWEKVPLLQKFETGTLSFSDLFGQHNEHRIVSERLVTIGLAELTRYNTTSEMLFNWSILCLTALIIFYVYWRRSIELGKNARLLILIPASFLLFGFRQYESILGAGTNQYYLLIFGAIAAFAALHASKRLDRWFGCAILASILASYSFATGLAVWFVGLFQILISGGEAKAKKFALWSLAGGIAVIIYMNGWVHPSGQPSYSHILQNPTSAALHFLALLGAPFTFGQNPIGITLGVVELLICNQGICSEVYASLAVAVGAVVLLIGVLVLFSALKAGLIRRNPIWVSLVIFIVINLTAETIGRSGFGLGYALSSRYTIITSIGIIALYLLAQKVSAQAKTRVGHYAFHALLTVMLIGLIVSYGVGWYAGGVSMYNYTRMSSYVLTTYKYQSDENIQQYLYLWNADYVREWAPWLQERGMSVFAEPELNASNLIPYGSQTSFHVDTINGAGVPLGASVTLTSTEKTFTMKGFAIDLTSKKAASNVLLVINDERVIPTLYGLEHQDVANMFHNPNYADSGWIASFSTSVFQKGVNAISLRIVASDGIHYYSTGTIFHILVS